MNTNIEQLHAEMKAKQEEKAQEVRNAMKMMELTSKMKYMETPLYLERQIAAENESKLTYIMSELEAFGKDSVQIKEVYGFSDMANRLLSIVKTVDRARSDVKDRAIEISLLDRNIIEQTILALGSYTYFSTNNEIVPSKPYDAERLKELLGAIANGIGLVNITFPTLTQQEMDRTEAYQAGKAKEKLDDYNANTGDIPSEAEELSYDS